ncbi:response regulator [candidate division WWE3 bacterium]|nr:response regulator [candidate division WWE3 bacterium]
MKKILLIEDEIFIRELYEKVLQGAGYEVVGVPDGQEGLNKARAEKYDLILLDIMLPKMTGIDVLKEIKKDPSEELKNTPIYLLTNLGQESIIKEAFKMGANGYLLKAKYLPNQIVNELDAFFKTNSSV